MSHRSRVRTTQGVDVSVKPKNKADTHIKLSGGVGDIRCHSHLMNTCVHRHARLHTHTCTRRSTPKITTRMCTRGVTRTYIYIYIYMYINKYTYIQLCTCTAAVCFCGHRAVAYSRVTSCQTQSWNQWLRRTYVSRHVIRIVGSTINCYNATDQSTRRMVDLILRATDFHT